LEKCQVEEEEVEADMGIFKEDLIILLNQQQKQEKENLTNDQLYYISVAKQASDYEALTRFLINTVKQNYKYGIDVATAIIN
jgi:hypothetical protein